MCTSDKLPSVIYIVYACVCICVYVCVRVWVGVFARANRVAIDSTQHSFSARKSVRRRI